MLNDMGAVVKLTVSAGPSQGTAYEFRGRATCLIGRARDCEPRLPADDQRVSRHHCLIDISPPDVRVRDFGSLNGTFVNGREIGRRAPGQTPQQAARTGFPEQDLLDGDEVRVGRTTLRVAVVPARPAHRNAHCTRCGRETAAPGPHPVGAVRCGSCRAGDRAVTKGAELFALAGAPDVDVHGYRLVAELGRGGQGVVYLARDKATSDLLALKVLLPAIAGSDQARKAFLREIKTVQRLHHKNIVRFRDTGEYRAAFYLACDYCPHGSLDQLLLSRGGTLPVDDALSITRQILDGLEHAHQAALPAAGPDDHAVAGLVHRDIKPANILISNVGAEYEIKISDFGLAKAFENAGLSGLTRTGDVSGTVCYMPRSQLVDYKYAKPEVDVWAAAATLYRMLTGTTPRDFPPNIDPIVVLLRESAVPARRRNRAIPRRLAQVIDEALVDSPQISVTTAQSFRRRLDST